MRAGRNAQRVAHALHILRRTTWGCPIRLPSFTKARKLELTEGPSLQEGCAGGPLGFQQLFQEALGGLFIGGLHEALDAAVGGLSLIHI